MSGEASIESLGLEYFVDDGVFPNSRPTTKTPDQWEAPPPRGWLCLFRPPVWRFPAAAAALSEPEPD